MNGYMEQMVKLKMNEEPISAQHGRSFVSKETLRQCRNRRVDSNHPPSDLPTV